MKKFQLQKKILLVFYSLIVGPAFAQHQDPSPTLSRMGVTETCLDEPSQAEIQAIKTFQEKLSALKQSLPPEQFQNQASKLIDEIQKQVSARALQGIVAVFMREKMLQIAMAFQDDTELKAAIDEFDIRSKEALEKNQGVRDMGFFERTFNPKPKLAACMDAGECSSRAVLKVTEAIRKSKIIKDEFKEDLIVQFLESSSEIQKDQGRALRTGLENASKTVAVIETTRNLSLGAALIVSAVVTGGATLSLAGSAAAATTSTLGAGGAWLVGLGTAAVAGTAAGAMGGGGYGLFRGQAGNIARATLGENSFVCNLSNEQSANREKILKDALLFAGVGGGLGATLATMGQVGGITAVIGKGLSVCLTGYCTAASVWGVTARGLEAKSLYEKAKLAFDSGNIEESERLLKLAHAASVEAGLSGVDTLLGVHALQKGLRSFKPAPTQSLKEPMKVMEPTKLIFDKSGGPVQADWSNGGCLVTCICDGPTKNDGQQESITINGMKMLTPRDSALEYSKAKQRTAKKRLVISEEECSELGAEIKNNASSLKELCKNECQAQFSK